MCTGCIEAYSCGCEHFRMVQRCAQFRPGDSEHYQVSKEELVGHPCSIHQPHDVPVRKLAHPRMSTSTTVNFMRTCSATVSPVVSTSANSANSILATPINPFTVNNLQAIAKQSLCSHISDITGEVVDRLISIEAKERNDRKKTVMAELMTQIQKGLDEIQGERDLNADLERATTRCWIQQVREGKKTLEAMEEGLQAVDIIGDSVRMEYVKEIEGGILSSVKQAIEKL